MELAGLEPATSWVRSLRTRNEKEARGRLSHFLASVCYQLLSSPLLY
jgi:hypothetical protein